MVCKTFIFKLLCNIFVSTDLILQPEQMWKVDDSESSEDTQ
jgi:hypothetical protein